jgi:Homeodomain-like domain
MKTAEREEARRLRREQGMSVRDITDKLGVSRSSVSIWVRDIELTPEQHAALLARNPAYNRQRSGIAAHARKRRRQRLGYQEHGRQLAMIGDEFHAAGCMLFWGEGSRHRNAVVFTNSDPAMAAFFLDFLRLYFAVADEEVALSCNLFADHADRQREIEDFWLSRLSLPRSCLRKTIVNQYSKYTTRKRTNMLPYGTCRIVVHRTRIVQSLYGSIQEYGRFERPEWLG